MPTRLAALAQKLLWPVALASVACGTVWGFYPLPGSGARLQAVPLERGEFHGRNLALTPRELTVLGRVDLIHRAYTWPGQSIFLTVIDGSKDRHAVHDPRYCFQGAGWKVVAEERRPIPGGESTWIAAERNGHQVETIFWFSDGAHRHPSVPRYLWETMLRRVSLGRLGSNPLLVVVQNHDGLPLDWRKLDALVTELQL